jgi:two-component system response regulator (stage 0 sporulation protein F)
MSKILIADDEKTIRDIFLKFFTLQGYEVSLAESGRDAIAKLNAGSFDMLIMDLKMPGTNGAEILREMQKNKKGAAIIILTGSVDAEDSQDLKELGYDARDILYKPVDLFELLEAVKRKLPHKV